tara:strand:- start:199 stop:672 length:474 start_codon:yes stop_codon:yes gene_type:complete
VCALGGLVKDEIHKKYMAILKRNGRSLRDDLTAYELDTIKNHETGNDQFKIDQWVDNYDMKAVPAFNSKNETWKNYVENTSLQNFNEIKLKYVQLGGIFSKIKTTKVIEKTGLTLKEWFDYDTPDALLNYFVSRADRNKGIKGIAKKTKYANDTKYQ